MYIRNKTAAVIFRVLFIIICGAGLVTKLIYSGFNVAVILSDLSLIANTLALIYFAYLIIARPGYERGILRGAVTIYMIVIFLACYYVNFGFAALSDSGVSFADFLMCFAAPAMAVIDYLFFCPKGFFSAYSPAIWVVLPLIFNLLIFVVNLIRMEVKRLVYFNILGLNPLITLLVFLGMGYLLFITDHLLAGKRR